MYSHKSWIYLREMTRHTIVAWVFAAIENKCCTLGGLAVTGRYTLITGHYEYICIIMQWRHYLGYLIKQKRCGMYVSWLQGGGKYYVIILAISTKYFGSANPLKCCNTRRHKSMSSWDKVPIQHNGENWESTFLLTYGIVVVPHEVP